MMPFTPMDDNIERVVESLERGLPEAGAPAAQGGIGADTPDLNTTQEALEQEGVLDEAQDQESKQ